MPDVVGNNNTLASGATISVNGILGGTNTYEKIIVTVVKLGGKEGAINVGKAGSVSATVFGLIMKTGETREFLVVATTVNLGANMGFFNPSPDSIRIDILGFVP